MITQKNKKKVIPQWENVKLPGVLVERMRKHKKETYIPVGKIAEVAITMYLDKK